MTFEEKVFSVPSKDCWLTLCEVWKATEWGVSKPKEVDVRLVDGHFLELNACFVRIGKRVIESGGYFENPYLC